MEEGRTPFREYTQKWRRKISGDVEIKEEEKQKHDSKHGLRL